MVAGSAVLLVADLVAVLAADWAAEWAVARVVELADGLVADSAVA